MASCEIHSSLLIYYLIESGILMRATSISNKKRIETLMLLLLPSVDSFVAVYSADTDTKKFYAILQYVTEWLSYFTAWSDKRWVDVMWQTSQTNNNNLNGYWFSLLSIPIRILCHPFYPSIGFIFPFISELIIFLSTNDRIFLVGMLNTYLISFQIHLSILLSISWHSTSFMKHLPGRIYFSTEFFSRIRIPHPYLLFVCDFY